MIEIALGLGGLLTALLAIYVIVIALCRWVCGRSGHQWRNTDTGFRCTVCDAVLRDGDEL